MRLLACHSRYQLHGGENIAFDDSVVLWRRAGHDVTTFERDSSVLAGATPTTYLRHAARAVSDPKIARDLNALIDRWRPEVAVVQNTLPMLTLAPYEVLAERGVPVIQVVYNYRYLCLNGMLYTGGKICERCAGGNFLHGVVRRCYRGSVLQSTVAAHVARASRRRRIWLDGVARYVAPDRFMVQKFAEYGLPEDRFRVIPNPVLMPPEAEPGEHEGTALFVGRWTQAKGVFTLLRAALEPGVPLVVMIGAGDAGSRMEKHEAVRQGRARLLGEAFGSVFENEVRRAMAVVVPSEWYDNLPMIVCQAFRRGRPVVACDINGMSEYVRHGVNGLLVPPGDSAALADALRMVGRDDGRWRSLAAGAQQTAEQDFSETRWISRWDALFHELDK